MVAGRRGLKRAWPAALAGGGSFALAAICLLKLLGTLRHGPRRAMVLHRLRDGVLRVWKPAPVQLAAGAVKAENPTIPEPGLTTGQSLAAWAPWVMLAAVMVAWSYFHLFSSGQMNLPFLCCTTRFSLRFIKNPMPPCLPSTAGGGNRGAGGDASDRRRISRLAARWLPGPD